MRKIIAGMFISLDGVVEAPDQWHFPYFNEEMGAEVGRMLDGADTMLIGRVTYDSFAGAWPDRKAAGEDNRGPDGVDDARVIRHAAISVALSSAADERVVTRD